MQVFRAEWFDGIRHTWVKCTLSASSVEEAKTHLRENQYVSNKPGKREDSLVVIPISIRIVEGPTEIDYPTLDAEEEEDEW